MELKGSIQSLKARVDASGEAVQSVSLLVFDDFPKLHALLKKPLRIVFIEDEKGPFES
jgi:hypothetical protein